MDGNNGFIVSAAIQRRLGDELIKDHQTAFFELIKNSYDADATEVTVEFSRSSTNGGKIIIRDNGEGMDENDIRNKWLIIGNQNKVSTPYSAKFKRRRLGAKGIGRLSTMKLGDKLKVTTRKADKQQFVIKTDYNEYTDDKKIEDVQVDIKSGKPKGGFNNGTILEIADLTKKWGKGEIKKLKDQLSTLVDSNKKNKDFSIFIKCDEHPDLDGQIENPLEGKETHKIDFSIDDRGNFIRKYYCNGEKKPDIKKKREPLECGPVEGIISYHNEGIKPKYRLVGRSQVTDEEVHTGVRIYRDSYRVRPYGEKSDDWLSIQKRRSSHGGKFYIRQDKIIGSIYISSDNNKNLKDATNREAGIIDHPDFNALINFVNEQIDFLNDELRQQNASLQNKVQKEKYQKSINLITDVLNTKNSEEYANHIDKLDRSKKGNYGQTSTIPSKEITDVKGPNKEEWQCNDCDERWRTPIGNTPQICKQYAVNRKGEFLNSNGCGSNNIERAKHLKQGGLTQLTSITSGKYAVVSGKQLKLRIDNEMGADEEEYLFDEREIVINGNHIAFTVAKSLDDLSGKKYEMGDDVLVPAITIHITKCVCLAWAEFHYDKTKNWDDYKERFEDLQEDIFKAMHSDFNSSSKK